MESGVSSVANAWSNFDWDSMQSQFESLATTISDHQSKSDESRANLIEASRRFKNDANPDARRLAGPILKLFQSEIDKLTERAEQSEGVVLKVFGQLVELPDPRTALENASAWNQIASEASDAKNQLAQCQDKIKQQENELGKLRRVEIRADELQKKLSGLEGDIEQRVQSQLSTFEQNLSQNFTLAEQNLQSQLASATQKLSVAENRVKHLNSALNEANEEIFRLKEGKEVGREVENDEWEGMQGELDRAIAKAEASERENERLRQELAEINSYIGDKKHHSADTMEQDNLHSAIVEAELRAKDQHISQLVTEVQSLSQKIKSVTETAALREADLTQKLQVNLEKCQSLEKQLERTADYEEVKRELKIMKSIEFGESESESSNSLEVLLLQKNKSLQADNMALRQRNSELQAQHSHTESELMRLQTDLDREKQLVQRLESDLLHAGRGAADLENAAPPDEPASPDAVIADAIGHFDLPPDGAAGGQKLSPALAEDSLLPIVASQRDRFRRRVNELEETNMQLQQQSALLETQVDTLRCDNIKLYEKLRYVQTYNNSNTSAAADTRLATSKSPQSTKKQAAEDTHMMAGYQESYERALDPFARFNMAEKERRYRAMAVHDKATLAFARVVLGSSMARAILFFYVLLMHFLVFGVLYKLAYTESCKRDAAAECLQKYREHMNDVHGDHDWNG